MGYRRLGFVALLLLALSATTLLHAHLNGPPPGYTGAPGEGTCADAGCHDSFPLNQLGYASIWPRHRESDTMDISMLVSKYEDNPQFGFQLTVSDSNGDPAGHFLITDSVRTRLVVDSLGREYVTHTALGTEGTTGYASKWELRWVSPSSELRPYTCFATGVASDADALATGDYVYTDSVTYLIPCPIEVPGDVNVDGRITSADVIYLANFVFKSGPPPLPCEASGDENCSGFVTASDIIMIVGHIFKNGQPPCDICNHSPMECVP